MAKPKLITEEGGKDVWEVRFETNQVEEVSGSDSTGATLGALLALYFPGRTVDQVVRTGRGVWLVYLG